MLKELDDNDWAQVFADENAGNVSKDLELHGCSDAPVSREDVAEIVCMFDGDNDGPDWCGVFRLADGRFLAASGGCDYTGWD